MPAIADQVATIEHDLAVAQTTCDSLRSENDQLKTALAALNADHGALQAKHIDAIALLDETRVHADGVASAALAMLKVSRRQIVAAPSEGTKALLNMPIPALPGIVAAVEARDEAMTADMGKNLFDESEKTDVRPELPEAEQGDSDMARVLAGDYAHDETDYGTAAELLPKQAEINAAHDITRIADVEIPNTDRLRAHMPGEDPLPIFLKPRAVPDANVLG